MEPLWLQKNVSEDNFEVQFEVFTCEDVTESIDECRKVIDAGIEKSDMELEGLQEKIDKLNSKIDHLTNHADGTDYMVAVGSGVLAGVIDILFVEDISIEDANAWGDKKTENFVIKIAKLKGYDGDDLPGAIKYLEDKFPMAGDKATNEFGGGRQHHLRDFSHHASVIGLAFSILTQFTGKVYGTDTAGRLRIVKLEESATNLIGKNFMEKILFGVIKWGLHIISDMAGSSTAAVAGKAGTGIPGPIGSFLKAMSSLPIFKNMNEKGYKEFSVWVSKLFDGTLLGERDANGKLIPIKFDLRTEIGLVKEISKQGLPVIVNECIVRGFYFVRRLHMEIEINNIQNVKELGSITWKNTLPFNNRTIVRMLTIATGTMTAIDVADAAIESAIKSGGVQRPLFATNMFVKINFVGVGRFTIAVSTDAIMGWRKEAARKKRKVIMTEIICVSTDKLYYKMSDSVCTSAELFEGNAKMFAAEANMWQEIARTEKAINELYECAKEVGDFYIKMIIEMDSTLDEIEKLLPDVEEMNPGLLEEMLRRLK